MNELEREKRRRLLSPRFTLAILTLAWSVNVAVCQPFADLECEVKKAALAYGGQRITGNLEALERGLNFASNCSHMTPATLATAKWIAAPDEALQFFVSADGDDTNPGSRQKPFETLAQARDALRFERRQLAAANKPWLGAAVNVMGGKYFLREPLLLSSEDSGTEAGQIIYQADQENAHSGKVILSGGVQLNLTWQKSQGDDRIYVAHVPSNVTFTTLFVNGVRQVRARFPNGDPQQMSGVCYYTSQEADEACPGYALTTGGIKEDEHLQHLNTADLASREAEQPVESAGGGATDPSLSIVVGEPIRPHHVTGDDHWSKFRYITGNSRPEVPGFKPVFSFWNNPYTDRPTGARYDPAVFNRTWANPETGVVHMFHTQYWGNWMFQISQRHVDRHQLNFAFGGWQEARGAGIGKTNHFYVENIREELDSPGEWFLDEESSMLYFYPNETQCPDVLSAEVVAPQHASVVRMFGTAEHPVSHVTFQGFTFTETSTTFMHYYEAPSGGDWTIHRNAAFFLEGAMRCNVNNNTFVAVGGNAVFLSEFVRDCTVTYNEITLAGDSAVASVGRTGMIDGMQPSYPAGNTISYNHIHDFGMYGKQVSCYFQALTCGNLFSDNICYNGPRAGINFNDGFGGGSILQGNLLFNMVRETDDHGMFNSWDRQPHVTMANCTSGPPSIVPAANHINKNFIINGYAGRWAIDHDDGSAYYNNTNNFMVFGGVKAYLGHDKITGPGNVIAYPGLAARSAGNRSCQCDDNGEFADQYYYGNQCFSPDGVFYTLRGCDPATLDQNIFQTRNNRHYSPGGEFEVSCGKKRYNFQEWQASGQDINTTVLEMPSAKDIVAMGLQTIQP